RPLLLHGLHAMSKLQILAPPEEVRSDAQIGASPDLNPKVPASRAEVDRGDRWVAAAFFLTSWVMPALLTLYLKWHAMADSSGFSRVARSIGVERLRLRDVLSVFRADLVVGFIAVPVAILFFARYTKPRLTAVILGVISLTSSLLLAIQLRALAEIGRYISLGTMWIALKWGLHEPGANVGYLSPKGIAAWGVGCTATIVLLLWAARSSARPSHSPGLRRALRIGGELYLLFIVAILAAGWKSSVPATPYHKSTLVRSVASLWNGDAVDTGEFAAFNFDHNKLKEAKLPPLSRSGLIANYRELTSTPAHEIDPRFFGKQAGSNVIFFVLETTPADFLSVDDDLKQFPNLARLRQHSFLAERHYTTLPVTVSAVFSIFTSWYPNDSLESPWGYASGESAPDLLPRLNAEGVKTAAFTPLHSDVDEASYSALGFEQVVEPPTAATDLYDDGTEWKAQRKANDVATLRLLENNMEQWLDSHQRFALAFLPQIAHFPYPDAYSPNSTDNLRQRGRAIIAQEDSWLGKMMDLLQKHGQLDNTIVVVVGDHGRRSKRENPDLQLGTIDGTAFHVPLFIYAPRALDEPRHIPWITSHIDIAPTVLDLLGVKDGRDSEQGLPIWQSNLAHRTTFFFAQPTFGADGYETDSRFYMWHYFSDSVYANSQADFDMRNFIPRTAPLASDITSKISTMVALEKQWHQKFAQTYPKPPDHP
ncbi:MAG: LTA synthase family protein, partial [Candidatus Acidiferrales bacterium]